MPDERCSFCRDGRCTRGLYGEFPSMEHCNRCAINTASRPPAPPVSIAVPHDQWPNWAKTIECVAILDDRGVGDTVKRRLGIAGNAFKSFMAAMGVPCRCDARQEEWNAKYPY